MKTVKIYVSPSSQTENRYVLGDTNEAEQCRAIAQVLVEALQRCGFAAVAGMQGDMYRRVGESDSFGADLHLPIHTNAYNKKVAGTRIYCYDTAGTGYRVSKAILAALAPITPGTSDSINARKTLYEIYKPKAPTAYVEVGFHDNEQEARWIIDNTRPIGEAICKGICNHYGVAYREPEEAVLYRVQVGAFENPDNARTMKEKLKAAGFPGFVVRQERGDDE
jgi:N-acetylmuramoyl-L-alanine amidase